ncbi:MAG: 16S rRNA (adenine(1518)-N(6)/adenine(1519)-N(6))-dimethyltransferase, partial [Deltaproteobacteria bacterium HGW-Deltaproteobacteria-24]
MEKIKAKKQFGQNFLKDDSILNKIIEAMPNNNNRIVEIGPGLGDLTQRMLKYKDMTAYEIDSDLLSILRSKFANEIQSQKLELIHTDVLDIWKQKKTLYKDKYDLIANLPYYVATNIILQAIEDDNCENIIVMIQKEVAQKFAAHEGEKE